MLKELNEKIRKVKEDMALKKVLQGKLDNLKLEYEDENKKMNELKKELDKEYKDVEKLEKLSLSSILATVMKNKEEKFQKEQQEYIMAKFKYEDQENKVNYIKQHIENIEDRLLQLRNCDNEYRRLLNEKANEIKGSSEENKLNSIEKEIDDLVMELKEIEEAQNIGNRLHVEILSAESALGSAKNWGIFDIAGGDFLSSLAKHNSIDEAQVKIKRISNLLSSFNKELGDVSIQNISFSSGTIAFDIWFDNIFTDFSVQSEINKTLDKIINLKGKVEKVLHNLQNENIRLEDCIKEKRQEYDKVLENI